MKKLETYFVDNANDPVGIKVTPPIKIYNLETQTEHIITKEYSKHDSLTKILGHGGMPNYKVLGNGSDADFNDFISWARWLEKQPPGYYELKVETGTFHSNFTGEPMEITNKNIKIVGDGQTLSNITIDDVNDTWLIIWFINCQIKFDNISIKDTPVLSSWYSCYINFELSVVDFTYCDLHEVSLSIAECYFYAYESNFYIKNTSYEDYMVQSYSSRLLLFNVFFEGTAGLTEYCIAIYLEDTDLLMNTFTMKDLYYALWLGTNSSALIYYDTFTNNVVDTQPSTWEIINDVKSAIWHHTPNWDKNYMTMIPPTSDPGIPGTLWNNAGTPTIST